MKIDIIIPCYNAKDTIFRCLSSIAIQRNFQDFHVYLVNDASDYDYDDFVSYFSQYFSINEIRSMKNVGPGETRNIGMKAGKSPYILFIDSDDILYSPYSLSLLYHEIVEKNSDVVISDFIYERDSLRIVKSHNNVWLHGKIYRRKFLESHNIIFPVSRANEDNGFNSLIFLLHSKISFLERITYIYKDNSNSITRKDHRLYRLTGLEGYSDNIHWALCEGKKRNAIPFKMCYIATSCLYAMYFYYLELFHEYDVSPILKWSKKILDYYDSYSHIKDYDSIFSIISDAKKKEYEENSVVLDFFLSFDQFLMKVRDYHD